jgi:hypothetical protein
VKRIDGYGGIGRVGLTSSIIFQSRMASPTALMTFLGGGGHRMGAADGSNDWATQGGDMEASVR